MAVGTRKFVITTRYRKFRGRGRGALEKSLGADGIFEIVLQDGSGNPITRKSLLFQAKKNWGQRDPILVGQAELLLQFPGSAVVVEYTPNRYSATRVDDVVRGEGDKSKLPEGAVQRLSKVLGEDFLESKIGSEDIHYDWERRELAFVRDGRLVWARIPAGRRVRSIITERTR